MPGVTEAPVAPALPPQWRASTDDHVAALAWAPNGALLAVAAVGGPVTLFEVATGRVARTLPGHGFGTVALSWHPGGALLASAGQDGHVRLWDAANGTERRAVVVGAAWAERVAWSPDGRWLATTAGRVLRLWDGNGQLVREYPPHPSTITDLQWHPRGESLAASAYGVVTLWHPGRPLPLKRFEWQGSSLVLAWSPDAKFLATGDQDSTVHFWRTATGKDAQMYGYPRKVRELAWDPHSRYLATGGGAQVIVWDCSGKGPEDTRPLLLELHEAPLTMLAWQRGGPLLASAAADGRVALWHPGERNQALAALQLSAEEAVAVAWAPDDTRLAVGGAAGTVAVCTPP